MSFEAPSGPPLPPPGSAPTPATPPPPTPPPPPPPQSGSASVQADRSEPRADVDELVARLHDEMDLGPATVVDPATPLTSSLDVTRSDTAQTVTSALDVTRSDTAQTETETETVTVTVTGDGPRGIDFDPTIASFGARIVGLVVDAVILGLLLAPGFVVARSGDSGAALVVGLALAVAGFAVATTLYVRGAATSGRSLGNRVAGTKVVDARNGTPLGHGRAGIRYVVRFLLSPVFLLGYLPALFSAQRRTFHDDVAGSIVTGRDRQTWSINDDAP